MTPDKINATFELAGAAFNLLGVHALWRDRVLKGYHWAPVVFFTAWGGWNLWFYPAIGQPWSFAAGIVLALVNLVWIGSLAYFKFHHARKHIAQG